jgi:hypothetical protein
MARAKAIAVTVAAAIAFSSATATAGQMIPPGLHHSTSGSNPWVPWVIIGCATMIVMTAMVANTRDNRQLTSPEAISCGILYWFQQMSARR